MPKNIIEGRIVSQGVKRIDAATATRLARHRLSAGDIVFPRRGDLSKRAIVSADQDGWVCGTGCLRFRAKAADLAPVLFEALCNSATTDWLVEHAVGTTMLNLNTTIVSTLPVPVLSGETAVIADACRAVAAAAVTLGAEVEALRTLRASLLTALLSQAITIPEPYDSVLEVAA